MSGRSSDRVESRSPQPCLVERKKGEQLWGLITFLRNLLPLPTPTASATDLLVNENGGMAEPTTEQRHLLETIWAASCSEKAWPKYAGVEKKLSDEGLNLRQLINSMPAGLMIPDVQNVPFVWTPQGNDELRVTLHGLRYCSNATAALELLARVVRYFADRERVFDIGSLSAPAKLVVTSDQVRRVLDLTDTEVQLVGGMVTDFHVGIYGATTSRGQWDCTIDIEDVRRYREVGTADDLFAAAPAPSVVNKSTAPERPRRAWHYLRAGLQLGQRVLEHKIVSSVIATLIAAALITWFGFK